MIRIAPPFALAATILALVASVRAQSDTPIQEARVKEALEWLASDDLKGRDTPSEGLELAAEWISKRFEAAGLLPGSADGYRHGYTLPGERLDSDAVSLVVKATVGEGEKKETKTIELKGGVDVRLLRPGSAADSSAEDANIVLASDPRLERTLQMGGARKPTVVVVAEDHPFWASAAGARSLLSRRIRNSAPLFLVREAALPEELRTLRQDGDKPMPPSWSLEWKGAAAAPIEIPLANLIGVVKGSEKPDEYIVVSAHYDHVGVGAPVDGDAIHNGADDDATGTTAVLLLAEAIAKGPQPKRSIAFVCFSAEEKGLKGSAAFVENPPMPLSQFVCNVNIEMLGRPEQGKQKQAWITGREYSDFASVCADSMQRSGIQVVDFPMAKNLFAASDNLSFAKKGIVAHSISAGSLHSDYHKPTDEVSRIDVPHMTAVIRGIELFVRDLANRDAAPQWNEEGKKVIERLGSR